MRNLSTIFNLTVILAGTWIGAATISGYVYNAENDRGLHGANMILAGTDYGTSTNGAGFYSLAALPAGNYLLIVSYLGFEKDSIRIDLAVEQSFSHDFHLRPSAIEMSSVIVSGQRQQELMERSISSIRLNTIQLREIPQAGDPDLMRSIQALPGILALNDYSTGLVIRGGNTDQNLILFDGATIYNPFHLFGLYSNFITDAIAEVEILKGGYSADYGDRLSAVINIKSRDGSREGITNRGSLSLMSGYNILEGPFDKGAYLIAARHSYFDRLFTEEPYYFPYYFFDSQGHFYQDFTENDRLSLSWYIGHDRLNIEDVDLATEWGNRAVNLNYRKMFNQHFLFNWHMNISHFGSQFTTGEILAEHIDEDKLSIQYGFGGSGGTTNSNTINDIALGAESIFFGTARSQLELGILLKSLRFHNQTTYLNRDLFLSQQSPLELAFYVNSRHWHTSRFQVVPGIRLYYYDQTHTSLYLDPRLRIKYLTTANSSINLATGIYHQFASTIQDDFNPSIINQWFAASEALPPAQAFHCIAGYELLLGNDYRIQIEGYYKKIDNMPSFSEWRAASDEIITTEKLVEVIQLDDGYSYGAELFIQKENGSLNGWLSYTYSVSKKFIGQDIFFTAWDRPQAVNLVVNYILYHNWQLNLKWSYQSGQPYTPVLGYYAEELSLNDATAYRTIAGIRNSSRYPPYHRLDIGVDYKISFRDIDFDLSLQVINAYNQNNVYRYFYQFGSASNGIDDDRDGTIDEPEEDIPTRKATYAFPFFPCIGVSCEF